MAVEYSLYDKDKINTDNLLTEITYPYEVMNRKKENLLVNDSTALLKHLLCEPRLKDFVLILQAGINPTYFFTYETSRYMELYANINRWGIEFFYNDADDMPIHTFYAINKIKSLVEDHETSKIKSMNDNGKNRK